MGTLSLGKPRGFLPSEEPDMATRTPIIAVVWAGVGTLGVFCTRPWLVAISVIRGSASDIHGAGSPKQLGLALFVAALPARGTVTFTE